MTRLLLTLVFSAACAGSVYAQSAIPPAGLAAEGEGRWVDALQIYREHSGAQTVSADLWVRIADIEARLGRSLAAIEALQRAAQVAAGDATVFARLSQAYAAQGHAAAALRAVEAALALRPASDDYLRAHAILATWAGEYAGAAASYRKLRQAHPDDHGLTLALARVSMWGGSSDAAAAAYREYLRTPQAEPDAWLELARAESWRGNVAAALDALREYAARRGETTAYSRERIAVLARGGRPQTALRELRPLLTTSPRDFDLALSQTIALAAARRHGAAVSSLAGTEALRPGHADTRAAESLVRTLLGSNLGPSATIYSDSDGLRAVSVAPKFDLGLETDTRVSGGYEHIDLEARAGSGLDQLAGASSASVEHAWAGLSQRVGSITVGGRVGRARLESHHLTTYGAFVKFVPADTLTLSVERSSGFTAISPRTVGLGLTRLTHRGQIEWMPSSRYHVALEGSHDGLSDGNARWEVFASLRTAVRRSQRLNLDLGGLVHQFGASLNLDNGYYDPRRYQYYSFVVFPYWKVSENVGVGATAGVGPQRDDTSRRFRFGSNVSVEANFGIYERWLLKVYGSTTNNRRLDSGAFRGTGAGVALLRRF